MNAYLKTNILVPMVSLAAGVLVHASTVLVSDTYNVTGSGSGFALNAGVNTGINPPTTRLTGTMAPNLRYMNTGTKATTAYTIGSNKLKVAAAANPGRFVLSANGTTAFDFGPALGVAGATPANPVIYDLAIHMDNDATGTDRCSFAIGTAEGDATTWAFGVQLYRAASGNTFYTIGKRIDTSASGLASDLNAAITTTASGTYGTELTFLIRVTDVGSESSTGHSRVQVSLDAGSTWIYDTASDSDLTSGFRFNGGGRIIMWDQAPNAIATYDSFSVTWNSGPHTWTGAGANGNWSTVANWGGSIPAAGDSLIFTGTTRQASTNDLASLSVPSVTFNNGGFTLWGNTLTSLGTFTNLAGINTFKQPVRFGSGVSKTVSAASGSELVFDNTTTFETNGDLTIVGGGSLRIKETMNIGQATTFVPAFIINEGKHIVDGGTFNTRGGYRIGSLATGAGAQTILTNGATMNLTAGTANLRVGDSANPNGAQLTLNNSTLTMAGGSLCVPFAAGAVGSVNQVGGTVSGCVLSFSDSGAGSGTYTVTGGTLQPLQISEGTSSGTSTIMFDNATLRPDAGASNPFMAGLNTAQINAGGLTIDATSDITVSQVMSGTGALTKTGSAALTLSGNNSFSGGTILSAGTLNVGNAGAAGTGTLTINGGTIAASGASRTLSNPVTIGGNFTVAGANALTLSGNVNLGSATRSINVANTATTTLSGSISGTGGLTKNNSGTLTLSGANTYSGDTTISAGTVALGVGGAIASPTITMASGATYDVSAVTGYALGATQTLACNGTSGAAAISGSITLASGAQMSLQADGTASSIGTVSVSGGLTLNHNAITINVTGAPLGVGTYPLLTYSGVRYGAFDIAPTMTGFGVGSGLTATLVQSAGTISLQVSAAGHGIAAAKLKVVENDLANNNTSVTVSTLVSINGMSVRDGSSRGDYTIQIGSTETDDFTNGAVMTCVAENGRDNGEDSGINYCTSSISSSSGVSYFIPTSQAPTGAEYNINVAAAYFPYSRYIAGFAKNSAGTSGGPNDSLTGSPGLVLGTNFIDHGDGTSTVDLTSMGINSQTDGILLVTAAGNDNKYAVSQANADGTWTILVKDNGTNGTATTQGPVSFAFVPLANPSVITGKFHSDGSILMYNGISPRFNVISNSTGTWTLSIPGYSPSTGVLVISPETSGGANADNLVSYQPSGSSWIITSRDLPQLGLQTPNDTVCSFIFIPAPTASLVAPANNSSISSAPTLTVTANSPSALNVMVTFYGHRATIPGPGPDFLIPVLPDTQNYAREASSSGQSTRQMWYAQTDWIISHRDSDNIPFVATLGDCVQNGDTVNGNPNEGEWQIATNAYYRLESLSKTKRLDGIPYLVTVGNHDQDPNGDPDGTTTLYNKYFGSSHFNGKSYYGGNFSTNNDSWYALFSAGNLDFLVISFEYGRYGSAILNWAQGLIDQYPTRRVIVLTHHAGDDTPDDTTVAPFSAQGQAIYTALRTNANFFMMLGGHVFNEGGEGRRSDTFQGHTVRTMISDYQGRWNGGNGLMRLLYFSPSNNLISVKTYTPYADTYETDANSQFTYTYNMQPNGAGSPATAYVALGTNMNVAPGGQTSFVWSGLQANKPYEWYVTVTDADGDYSTSVVWSFSTTASFSALFSPTADANGNGLPDAWERQYNVSDPNADDDHDGQSNYAEYMAHTNPTDPSSVFKIVSTGCDASGHVTLTWSSVGGTRYRVQVANGAGEAFTDVVRDASVETDSAPAGQSSTQSYTDDTSSPNTVRFYRVEVVP